MNKEQFLKYCSDFSLLDSKSLEDISALIEEFPYFQTARILYAKNLNSLKDVRFENKLRNTVVYVPDRKHLVRLINLKNLPENEITFIDEPKLVDQDIQIEETKQEEPAEIQPVNQEIEVKQEEIIETPQVSQEVETKEVKQEEIADKQQTVQAVEIEETKQEEVVEIHDISSKIKEEEVTENILPEFTNDVQTVDEAPNDEKLVEKEPTQQEDYSEDLSETDRLKSIIEARLRELGINEKVRIGNEETEEIKQESTVNQQVNQKNQVEEIEEDVVINQQISEEIKEEASENIFIDFSDDAKKIDESINKNNGFELLDFDFEIEKDAILEHQNKKTDAKDYDILENFSQKTTYSIKGLEVIYINIGESAKRVGRFVQSNSLHYRVLLDEN